MNENPPLTVSLISTGRNEYTVGDEFSYALEVSNHGTEAVKIPTVFNLADFEPDDPSVSFNYSPMEIWLTASESNEQRVSVLLLTLYGSDEMPWTEIELKPGGSVEIRGKAKLERTDRANRVFYAPYVSYSSDLLPKGEVLLVTSYWRGVTFHFEGSTQHEYAGGCPEELRSTVYEKKITFWGLQTSEEIHSHDVQSRLAPGFVICRVLANLKSIWTRC